MGSVLDLDTKSHENIPHFDRKISCKPNLNKEEDMDIVDHSAPQEAGTDIRLILRVESGSNNHPAKVSEAVLPPHNEERLIKVRVIFSQFLLLDFSAQTGRVYFKTYTVFQ